MAAAAAMQPSWCVNCFFDRSLPLHDPAKIGQAGAWCFCTHRRNSSCSQFTLPWLRLCLCCLCQHVTGTPVPVSTNCAGPAACADTPREARSAGRVWLLPVGRRRHPRRVPPARTSSSSSTGGLGVHATRQQQQQAAAAQQQRQLPRLLQAPAQGRGGLAGGCVCAGLFGPSEGL